MPWHAHHMRLGASLPFTDPSGGPLVGSTIADASRRLAGEGFESIWTFDAIGRGIALPDPLIALAVAATVTDSVDVGTCILQVPLRRPVELAHRIMTTHLIAGDRLQLGVGAGSTKADFDAVGVPFEERHRRFADGLADLKVALANEGPGDSRLTTMAGSLRVPRQRSPMRETASTASELPVAAEPSSPTSTSISQQPTTRSIPPAPCIFDAVPGKRENDLPCSTSSASTTS
jgi:alkanesulfonate monooxygenase SsuD/methylene tetrahydromethanopterin reductase-like flavin-dependent oxidoreductase (luciferase family)